MINLFLLCFSLFSFSQGSPEPIIGDPNNLEYEVKLKIPTKVKHQYRVEELSKVSRTFEDGSVYEYNRDYSFWVTFWAPDDMVDGFTELEVFIDSLQYNFKDDKIEVNYYNEQDEAPPTHRNDFLFTFIPSSSEFKTKIDAYGVIGSAYGGNLDENREKIVHPEYGIKDDDYRLWIFKKRYSDQDMKHLLDITKGVLPPYRIGLDSAYDIDYEMDINFHTFKGLVKPKIEKLVNNSYFIKMNFDSLKIKEKNYHLIDKKIFAEIDSSNSSGNLELEITARGILKNVLINSNTYLEGRAKNIKFREKIESKLLYDLIGMWHL